MARSHFREKQNRKKIQMREEKETEKWKKKKSKNLHAKTAEQRKFSHKMIPLRIFLTKLHVDYL